MRLAGQFKASSIPSRMASQAAHIMTDRQATGFALGPNPKNFA